MKIAIPYPGYWPYVRRGVERCIHDLAGFLARRGHEVHVITSTPRKPRTTREGDVKVTYLPQLSHPLLFKYQRGLMMRAYAFSAMASRLLVEERPDVMHLWTHSGIRWASTLRRRFGLKYVSHVSVYWDKGHGPMWFPEVLGADKVLALNHVAAAEVEAEFGVPCGVLPPPVDMDTFRPSAARDTSRPVVLFAADLTDPRKGGSLLLRAWSRVYRRCPRARLALAGSLGLAGWMQDQNGETMLSRLDQVEDPAARAAIEIRGPGALAVLPTWYSQASVTVLPSVDEAFGMVLTESLACGTPVVASAHHGPGEILAGPSIGAAVDLRNASDLVSARRAEELADAILQAIELSAAPATAARCRDWAAQWSLERIGAELERTFSAVVAGETSRRVALSPDHGYPVESAAVAARVLRRVLG